jgi:predicted metal-dependent hydrolase
MANFYRFAPDFQFPAYRYQPGQEAHPGAPGGHSRGIADPIAFSIDESYVEKNECLRIALDLLNHEYYWESHVYFEALWNAEGRQGMIADFLKALVKLGAAGVKLRGGNLEQANVHLMRAKELFEAVRLAKKSSDVDSKNDDLFLGFSLFQLVVITDSAMTEGSSIIPIYPTWK